MIGICTLESFLSAFNVSEVLLITRFQNRTNETKIKKKKTMSKSARGARMFQYKAKAFFLIEEGGEREGEREKCP
jgi:hypothetical protein